MVSTGSYIYGAYLPSGGSPVYAGGHQGGYACPLEYTFQPAQYLTPEEELS